MRQLGGLDAAFVYAETPSWHMNVGVVMVLDPSTAPAPLDLERLRALLGCRLDAMGPFRQQLVPVPFGVTRPFWTDEARVEPRDHVRSYRVPTPGGREELADAVGELLARKLDRRRPMWELWLLEGLADGRVALLVKVHHSLFDGVAGLKLYEQLCDLDPDAPLERRGGAPSAASTPPASRELSVDVPVAIAKVPFELARTGSRLARSALRLLRFSETEQWSAATFPFQAPRTSLNGRLTPRRRFGFASIPLPAAQAVKAELGVTLNDVVLAVTAGAVRRYLADRAELPLRPLIAQIPIGVGTAADAGRTGGNALSVIGASLATDLEAPDARLRAIHVSTDAAKGMHRALGEDIIEDCARLVPPPLLGLGIRTYSRLGLEAHHPPIFSLIVSSMTGPPCPLYVAGARLLGGYPIGPLLDGGGLNVSVISYDESLDFGFCVCPDLVPDPWRLADGAADAFDELHGRVLAGP